MTISGILQPIAAQLQLVSTELEAQLLQISEASLAQFQSLTDDVVHHLFDVHGKYLRPSLVLLTAQALQDKYPVQSHALVKIATAVELVHSASLVHDDIIDVAEERRGHPSLNSVFGNKMAVLVGDLLYDQVFTVLTELTDLGTQAQLSLFELFTTTARKMCLGEIYEEQIVAQSQQVSFSDYLQVVDYKTGALMACCCRASAIAAGADESDTEFAEAYGLHLGRTYQLVDDIVDQDSVYYDRKIMLDLAVEEAALGTRALEQLASNDGTRRLAEISQSVIKRTGKTARA